MMRNLRISFVNTYKSTMVARQNRFAAGFITGLMLFCITLEIIYN